MSPFARIPVASSVAAHAAAIIIGLPAFDEVRVKSFDPDWRAAAV
jgi:hypothetical protein